MALLRKSAYINGGWIDAIDGGRFDVLNPADDAVIASVPDMDAGDAATAIAAAETAWQYWRSEPPAARAAVLRAWEQQIQEHKGELAELLTLEQGKPLAEAQAEIDYGAAFIRWFADEAEADRTERLVSPDSAKDMRVIRQPIGVVAAITPWNFPVAMVTRKCAPAIAAGCSVVLKPAEATPLSALALAELADRAGIPSGVFNVLTCSAGERVGVELTRNPVVRKLSFTGSTAIGKQLLGACAGTVKNVSMELGGNAPFIIFDDADIDLAVAGTLASKFRNTGQTCISPNRIYVQSGIYDRYAQKLSDKVGQLKSGSGMADGVRLGPLINRAALEKVQRHVVDAVAKGAQVLCGGQRHDLGGAFYMPTVLTDMSADMLIAKEETFGPVAPLFRFESEAEVVAAANDTQSGLAAYVYSADQALAERVATELEYGMVGIVSGRVEFLVVS